MGHVCPPEDFWASRSVSPLAEEALSCAEITTVVIAVGGSPEVGCLSVSADTQRAVLWCLHFPDMFSLQILTQEDWNKVLYNGMASTSSWAALYFIALMTFGNYVLFNLLVAILVEGFQTEVMSSHSCLCCLLKFSGPPDQTQEF